MNVFLSSDFHLFHTNIIKYCSRPFSSVEEMNKKIIENHNSLVTKEDLWICLGDLTAGIKPKTDFEKIKNEVQKLNGKKILVKGNHDHFDKNQYLEMGFETVCDYLILEDYFFCHYYIFRQEKYDQPELKKLKMNLENKYKEYKCKKLFYGHSHKTEFSTLHKNVCVDLNNFFPIKLE